MVKLTKPQKKRLREIRRDATWLEQKIESNHELNKVADLRKVLLELRVEEKKLDPNAIMTGANKPGVGGVLDRTADIVVMGGLNG